MASTEIDHSSRAHAVLSASGAARWMNCTPSARMEQKYPESTSEAAEEGTTAHELAEVYVRRWSEGDSAELDAKQQQVEQSKYYSDEMPRFVSFYSDYVRELYAESVQKDSAALVFTEARVDFSQYVPDGFGTSDNIVVGGGVMDVIDLKYGQGIRVSSVDNPQLKSYALGAYELVHMLHDIDMVRLHIVQPRLDHVSVYELSLQDLLTWATEELAVKAEIAHRGEGEQVPGDWCTFCKVQYRCAARRQELEQLAVMDFADPRELSDSDILEVLQVADRVKKWLNGLSGYVLQEALAGKKWPGYKVVAGRSTRMIVDEDKAVRKLRSLGLKAADYQVKKLQTMTHLQKLLGKKVFDEAMAPYMAKSEGAPTLVPESDKRPELSGAHDFAD